MCQPLLFHHSVISEPKREKRNAAAAHLAEVKARYNLGTGSKDQANPLEKLWLVSVVFYAFLQLRERKNGLLVSKRHQMKHLASLIPVLESSRSMVQNHSPRPLFLSYPQSFTLLLLMPIFGPFSVHSVQRRAARTQRRTVLPTFFGTPRPLWTFS
jgi:hypothetical protein